MSRNTYAEIAALDRILHLLEEGSVNRLAYEDYAFGVFIGGLYGTVQSKAEQLSREVKSGHKSPVS